MEVEQTRLGDFFFPHSIDQVDGACMSHDLLMVFQGLAPYGEPPSMTNLVSPKVRVLPSNAVEVWVQRSRI